MSKQSAQAPARTAGLERDDLLKIYATMRLIRAFEDKVHDLFAAGGVPGFVHLYAGEEAVAAGVMAALREDDYITSTHRGHGHCIAKGVDVKEMLAEIYGCATGCCKGKGGSMHIADVSKGMLGANGIVGAGPPLAVGAALSAKSRGSGQIAACFFGDGASNQGTFHEALNMASIWDLPCLFICENNVYAETTSTAYSMRVKNIADRAAAYSIPGVVVDGQDVIAVYAAAREAADRARAGGGPTLIEAKTYRNYGHFEGDSLKYRPAEEVEHYRGRDPLVIFAEQVAPGAGITPEDLEALDQKAEERIAEAVAFVESSAMPEPEDCLTDVYTNY